MKKDKHLSLAKVIFHCISCNKNYDTNAAFSQENNSDKMIQIESCINCNPFYTGASASQIKVGAVEKFHKRADKVKVKT